MDEFIKRMPKIELHAHLNGSLTKRTFTEIGKLQGVFENDNDLKEKLISSQMTVDADLSDCFKKFQFAHELTSTVEGLERVTFSVIRDFCNDNVIYLELRTTPKKTETMSKYQYLRAVLDEILLAQFVFPRIKVKLLPSIDRADSYDSAKETLTLIKLFMDVPEYASILKGIDFSGHPGKGQFATFKPIFEEAREVNLKLALHCGEIDNEKEVAEMLDFGMDRCGHGTFIKEYNLERMVMEKIPIECCLTSNIKCKTIKDYNDHHFKQLFENNHPVVICTDDMGVFNTSLSNEFEIVKKNFNLDKQDLQKLSMNAVNSSFADDEEKTQMKNTVKKYFGEFDEAAGGDAFFEEQQF